ncbi:protein translocase subunit SecA-like [Anopheles gambiae]|uniref:protein translocase subunit SecA-like n=1 Tax=Anopheles gambiae TaxID=7165 RepID=UPI002AC96AA3|nr:protein translocase subunit SecA-like [Anopheles gambiae]XP_061510560.1 protein translocase subunit SecA-like [Anopheles gambiae]
MLLDKANNILYLSHDIAGMDKLESVYLFIWQMVNNLTDLSEDELVKKIKQSVLSDMYAIIQKEDIQSLDNGLGKSNVLVLWERLMKSGIIDYLGRLQTEAIDSNKLEKVLSPDFTQYKDRLSFMLTSCLERKTYIKVPNYLKSFVERHLVSWISSAVTALYMVPDQYYVVGVDNSLSGGETHPNVIIVDRDTGTDQVSSQWDEALHQFLQLKHGCKLSTLSLKAVFISNVTYLKEYKLLYGLTGTLGSKEERTLLKKIHDVDFVTVPTFKLKLFKEYEPIICSSSEDWKQHIRKDVDTLTKIKSRSILIICETIRDVEALKTIFAPEQQNNVRTYKRDDEDLPIEEGGLEPGQVIIATNLAGRGTDIKITKKLEKAGGLHVILTFLPTNVRIEEQAFGRAARKGEKGSGRMIIKTDDTKIHTLKSNRNAKELLRLIDVKTYYDTMIKTEEECFEAFKKLYEKEMICLTNVQTPDAVKEILLQSCLDRWSFWLDENNVPIGKASDEATKDKIKLLLKNFLSQFDDLKATSANNWPAWVEENPMQMIKLGTYISAHDSKHRNTAMQLFGKVISSEPYFCEAAYYYRAYTRSLDNMNVGDFKKDLRMAEKLFNDHIKYAMHASVVISELNSIKENKAYAEQHKNLINLYSLFIQSIDDMLGHAVSPESFVNYEIKEDVAGIIFDDLVRIGMIKKAQVIDNIPNDQIQRLHAEYGIPVDQLKKFLAQHRGPIDDKEFLKAIRESFSFPSRSEFWKELINQKVLHSVESYVAVIEERLKIMDPALMNYLKEKVDKGDLVKEVINVEKEQILLIAEEQSQFYFGKANFFYVIGRTKYNSLEENGLLSFNEKAIIDKSRIDSCMFSAFDSITIHDLI